MSSHNRKKKRKCWSDKDHEARIEGTAIDKMKIIGPVQAPRLNKTYDDGSGGLSGLHVTGKKHRKV